MDMWRLWLRMKESGGDCLGVFVCCGEKAMAFLWSGHIYQAIRAQTLLPASWRSVSRIIYLLRWQLHFH